MKVRALALGFVEHEGLQLLSGGHCRHGAPTCRAAVHSDHCQWRQDSVEEGTQQDQAEDLGCRDLKHHPRFIPG